MNFSSISLWYFFCRFDSSLLNENNKTNTRQQHHPLAATHSTVATIERALHPYDWIQSVCHTILVHGWMEEKQMIIIFRFMCLCLRQYLCDCMSPKWNIVQTIFSTYIFFVLFVNISFLLGFFFYFVHYIYVYGTDVCAVHEVIRFPILFYIISWHLLRFPLKICFTYTFIFFCSSLFFVKHITFVYPAVQCSNFRIANIHLHIISKYV